MKKQLFFFAIGLFAASMSFAQKGSVLVGGDLSFNYLTYPQTSTNAKSTQWNLSVSPVVGYQFANAWTAGLILGYGHVEDKQLGQVTNSGNTWEVGPFVRYTHALSSWVSLYGQFQATYLDQGKVDQFNAYQGEALLYPALFFDVKNGFGINLSLGGLSYTYDHIQSGGTTQQMVNLTFGNTVLIGVSKNFGGHRKGA